MTGVIWEICIPVMCTAYCRRDTENIQQEKRSGDSFCMNYGWSKDKVSEEAGSRWDICYNSGFIATSVLYCDGMIKMLS
jgi:hypothetical protein